MILNTTGMTVVTAKETVRFWKFFQGRTKKICWKNQMWTQEREESWFFIWEIEKIELPLTRCGRLREAGVETWEY